VRTVAALLLIAAYVCSGSAPSFAQGNTFPSTGNAGVGTTAPGTLNPGVFSRFIVVRGATSGVPGLEPGTPAIILSETSNKFGDPVSTGSIGVCSDGNICIWDEREFRMGIGRTGLKIAGADLAEPFDVAAPDLAKPGMLVSIDPTRPGQMRVSSKAYDRTVAGVISGANGLNPGITMGKDSAAADGSIPVALTGRVYALADATGEPIMPGDLLTTSYIPGHAMRVTDHVKAQGAIIGKAMSSLESGRGTILVLVSLQ
jgi:hypothetical protein